MILQAQALPNSTPQVDPSAFAACPCMLLGSIPHALADSVFHLRAHVRIGSASNAPDHRRPIAELRLL